MTSAEREQWAKAAERTINIRALGDDLPCKQMACLEVEKERDWWVQKAKELNLWNQGDDDRVVLGRVQEYLATTPPELWCPCNKGVVLEKASQHLAGCDARTGLLLLKEKLHKEKCKEMAAQREQQHIKECARQEKAAAQAFERAWKDSFAPYFSGQFLRTVKTVVNAEVQFRYKYNFSPLHLPLIPTIHILADFICSVCVCSDDGCPIVRPNDGWLHEADE